MEIFGFALTLGGLTLNVAGVVFFIAATWQSRERLFEASNPRVGSATIRPSSPPVKLGLKANRQTGRGLAFVLAGFVCQGAGAVVAFVS